jgi:hypothetical protein
MKSPITTPFQLGQRIPGTEWVLHGILGQGGMGTVFEVRKGQDLRAAMKVLHPDLARDRKFAERFQREVAVMARLRHPNIVSVWDSGCTPDGTPYFLMELLTGRTLRALKDDPNMPLTAETVWKVVGQICAGLGHAHSDSPPVVHRDVKPENVYLHGGRGGESKVKLLDFGVATVLGAMEPLDAVVGTPRFIAPEVLRGEAVTAKVDLYAVAVLAYELLTQAFPWRVNLQSPEAVGEAHLKLEPIAPSRWKSWIPKSVDECLLQALAKDPERRQRSVGEFYRQLAELEVVDDGSAKYTTDAPTIPNAETMAHGRTTAGTGQPATAEGHGLQAVGRRWIAIVHGGRANARSRVEGMGGTSDTMAVLDELPPPRRPESKNADDEETRDARVEQRAARGEEPATTDASGAGATSQRAKKRRHALSAALLSSATALLAAATWRGAEAARLMTRRMPALTDEHASEAAIASLPAVERAVPSESRMDMAPHASAVVESLAAAARGAAETPAVVETAQASVDAGHRTTAPPRPTTTDSTPQPPNLDGRLLAMGHSKEPPSAPSARREGRGDGPPNRRSVQPPPNLDDVFFGDPIEPEPDDDLNDVLFAGPSALLKEAGSAQGPVRVAPLGADGGPSQRPGKKVP